MVLDLLKKIQEVLDQAAANHLALTANLVGIWDHRSLVSSYILHDYRLTIVALSEILLGDQSVTLDTLQIEFGKFLQNRRASTHDTALALTNNSDAPANALIFALFDLLYPRATPIEMWAAIVPQVTEWHEIFMIMPEHHQAQKAQLQLEIKILSKPPPLPAEDQASVTATSFHSRYWIAGSIALSISPIVWQMQKQLYAILKQDYPQHLALLLKQENNLFRLVKSLYEAEMTPRQAIENLAIALLRGGTSVSGVDVATAPAMTGIATFFEWFNALPANLRETLNTLLAPDNKKLGNVLKLLIEQPEQCVEQASAMLKCFSKMQGSASAVLDASPHVNREAKRELRRRIKIQTGNLFAQASYVKVDVRHDSLPTASLHVYLEVYFFRNLAQIGSFLSSIDDEILYARVIQNSRVQRLLADANLFNLYAFLSPPQLKTLLLASYAFKDRQYVRVAEIINYAQSASYPLEPLIDVLPTLSTSVNRLRIMLQNLDPASTTKAQIARGIVRAGKITESMCTIDDVTLLLSTFSSIGPIADEIVYQILIKSETVRNILSPTDDLATVFSLLTHAQLRLLLLHSNFFGNKQYGWVAEIINYAQSKQYPLEPLIDALPTLITHVDALRIILQCLDVPPAKKAQIVRRIVFEGNITESIRTIDDIVNLVLVFSPMNLPDILDKIICLPQFEVLLPDNQALSLCTKNIHQPHPKIAIECTLLYRSSAHYQRWFPSGESIILFLHKFFAPEEYAAILAHLHPQVWKAIPNGEDLVAFLRDVPESMKEALFDHLMNPKYHHWSVTADEAIAILQIARENNIWINRRLTFALCNYADNFITVVPALKHELQGEVLLVFKNVDWEALKLPKAVAADVVDCFSPRLQHGYFFRDNAAKQASARLIQFITAFEAVYSQAQDLYSETALPHEKCCRVLYAGAINQEIRAPIMQAYDSIEHEPRLSCSCMPIAS